MTKLPLITVDTDAASSCRELIVSLQNAYMSLAAGNTRVQVRHMDRWTEYTPGKVRELLNLINTLYAQCPDTEGLLDFNPARRTQRGRPIRFAIN